MRSRRDSVASDNLGLLLDAICNTFGAVLLIAILVAVLLSTSAKEIIPSEDQIAMLETLNNEKDRKISLERERDDLKLILEKMTGGEAEPLPDDQKRLIEDLEKRIASLRSEKETLESMFKSLRARPEELKDEKKRLEEAVAELKLKLRLEIEKRTEIAGLPVLQSDSNEQIAVLVRYGRFYLTHTYNNQGERVGINTTDMILKTNADGDIEARAKPTGGIDLQSDAGRAKIRQLMRSFNPRTQSIVVFTGRASFDSYRKLAEMLVEMDFGIFPWPMSDEGVWDRGGDGGKSQ